VPTHFLLSLFAFIFSFSGYTFHIALNLWILRHCFCLIAANLLFGFASKLIPDGQSAFQALAIYPFVCRITSILYRVSVVLRRRSSVILTKRKLVSQEFALSSPLPGQTIHRPEL
jgi:hypothetical protein